MHILEGSPVLTIVVTCLQNGHKYAFLGRTWLVYRGVHSVHDPFQTECAMYLCSSPSVPRPGSMIVTVWVCSTLASYL